MSGAGVDHVAEVVRMEHAELRQGPEAVHGRCLGPGPAPDVLATVKLIERTRHAAAVAERERLGRELHDGILQFLTGMALQVQALRGESSAPEPMRERLAVLHALIVEQQQELRCLVERLRAAHASSADAPEQAPARLAQLAKCLTRQWGLGVQLELASVHALAPATEHALARLVSEGVANAARHGRASAVQVYVRTDADQLRITLTDNGLGFPFRGRYDHGALCVHGLGPRSLRERVGALGGELSICSSARGARLEIGIPLAGVDAGA
jgi:signal transduction histidine kinase